MNFVAVCVGLLVLGGIAGIVGPKLGTALALIPVAAWFALFLQTIRAEEVEGAQGDELLGFLLVGLVAFLVGSNLTSRVPPSQRGGPE